MKRESRLTMIRPAFCLALLLLASRAPGSEPVSPPPTGGTDEITIQLAETFLKGELARKLGPAQEYQVRVDRETTNLTQGQLGPVDVTGLDVQTKDGLIISRLEIHLDPSRIGPNFRPVEGELGGTFLAEFSKQNVTRYVRRRMGRKLPDFQLAFYRDRIVVRGKPDVSGVDLPSEVAGRPYVRRGSEVHFRASRVKVLGIRITEVAANALEKRINPVINLADLDLPIQIRRLRVRRNALTLEGNLDLSELTRKDKTERKPARRKHPGTGEGVPAART